MEIGLCNSLDSILTTDRLDVYRQDGVDNCTAVARYLWNIEVSKSLYPLLHVFEITLRNAIDHTLQDYTKQTDWYEVLSCPAIVHDMVDSAKEKLKRERKLKPAGSRDADKNHGKIIAELTLGFWTGFFGPAHSRYTYQSKIIRQALPFVPVRNRSVTELNHFFNDIRTLRNRVSQSADHSLERFASKT